MIDVIDKSKCCGCAACVQRCPRQCITMHSDKEGFLYPKVDIVKCTDCGLCEKVCPVLNVSKARLPQKVYAAKNRDEVVRCQSSSGGVFTILAEKTINAGGVVFGVMFNENWEVVHSYTETIEGLAAFRGSKYVQSIIGNSYKQVEVFLKQGREVLFSGTPCQIAGLKRFLRKEYDNLLTVECVCHGVPSPLVWHEYLNDIKTKNNTDKILDVKFRVKSAGWKKYSVSLKYSNKQGTCQDDSILYYKNPYMQAFLRDFILRPSCYSCPAKAGRSGADIALADFWGIEKLMPHFDDDKGCSLVLDYTSRTDYKSRCEYMSADYDHAVKYNPAIVRSVAKPLNRAFFFHRMNCGKGCVGALNDIQSTNPLMRAYRLIYRKFSK